MKARKYCTLYIVRHGRTEWNELGLTQGQKDSPLTKEGEQAARNLGEEFRNINFDKVFSSDLLRAKRTAEIITLERNLAVETTKLLRERSYGVFEGEHRDKTSKLFEKYHTLSFQEKYKYKTHPSIESDEEIMSRMITFLREVAITFPGKTLLIVTHGDLIHNFLIKIGFGNHSNFPHNSIGNTSYIKLESDGIDFFVKETKGIKLPKTYS